ncbi:MAG: DUF58 domain-containing protein [Ruminococcus sp.]|nr:DUF58 domain-containing protein [Ruminococcus sp.]
MKAVLSYMMVFFAAAFYMLLFDRAAGAIMIVFLAVIPAVSVFLTVFTRKKLEFSVVVDDSRIKKNKKSKIQVYVKKNTVLPVPIVSFSVKLGERFRKPEYDTFRFSMSENKHVSIDIDVFPEVFGTAEILIDKIYITDYLGIFKFKTKTRMISEKIYILPEIKEFEDGTEIFRSIYASLPDNDDDETTAFVYGRASFPGYEYREYMPGDSLKKINWKLSSKKDRFYVRMDESAGMTLPDIILDTTPFKETKNDRYALLMEEMIAEGALSLLMMCVNNGIECTFSYQDGGVLKKTLVSSPRDVEELAFDICMTSFEPSDIVLEAEEFSKSTDVSVVYTLDVSEKLAASAEDFVLKGNSVKIIIPEQLSGSTKAVFSDMWTIGEDLVPVRVL